MDDFGATPLNVYRFAKQAERAGIGCAAFDDRMPLNRATADSVPGVVSKARMIDNIHAAAGARTDMVLIAHCLAPTPNGSYAARPGPPYTVDKKRYTADYNEVKSLGGDEFTNAALPTKPKSPSSGGKAPR